jgi:hypothetical protein
VAIVTAMICEAKVKTNDAAIKRLVDSYRTTG